jgi:hypothetical protein
MTAEHPVSPGEMRVSHADRDQVVDRLRVAAGEGRLTAEELDERVEAALVARTFNDLSGLTADLPTTNGAGVAATVAPKDVLRVERIGGGVRRSGPWVLPRRIEATVVGGSVRLDLTEAVITLPTLEIALSMRGGSLHLLIPTDVVVDADEVVMLGGGVRQRAGHAVAGQPRLRVVVTGSVTGGSVVVRAPRHRRGRRVAGR